MQTNKSFQPALGIVLVTLLTFTSAAQARDAQDILQKSQRLLQERQQGVDVYLVEKTVMGHTTRTYHRRTSFTAQDGSPQTAFIPYAEHQPCQAGRTRSTPTNLIHQISQSVTVGSNRMSQSD